MTLFERIKSLSKKQGISLKKVAEKAELSENVIYSWKNRTPSSASLDKVAKALNVSVSYLLNEKEDVDRAADIDDLSQIMRFQGREIPESQREIVLKILKELNDEQNNK